MRRVHESHALLTRALLGLLAFGAISALVGGALGVVVNGAGVPLEYLEATPFDSYVIPGLILGVVVGGTQGFAAISTQRRRSYGLLAAAVAGFGMTIWIFVEVTITGYSWLQVVFLGLGIGEIALVLLLLGILHPSRTWSDPRPGARSPGKAPR
ncbi:hypothetical protein ACFXQA_06080 [Microbacterium sp. P07]|uniref:hypothetical protein n=1 Tax=Microbacterium sp. P07 TaxID=3366952 RepID=UPI0037471FCC